MATLAKIFYTTFMKECRNCHQVLDDSCFSRNLRNKDGLNSYCKKCVAMKAKEYNQTKGKDKMKQIYKRQMESGYFLYGHGAYVNKKKSAQKRHIDFCISEEEFIKWWLHTDDICHYCGCNVEEYKNERNFILDYTGHNPDLLRIKQSVYNTERAKRITDMTVDRKDSKKGYSLENIVKSCWICNSLKSNSMSEEEAKTKLKNVKNTIKGEMNNNGKNK